MHSTEIFDAVISLGCNCTVAHHLQRNFLRTESLPFDWLITPQGNKVQLLTENRFRDFPGRNNLEEIPNVLPYGNFLDKKYNARLVHDFIANGLDIQYDYIFEKYRRRGSRFLEILNSGEKCLFIRKLYDNADLRDTVALGKYLQEFNKENCIYVITTDECAELRVEPIADRIFQVTMSHKYDNTIHDDGNYGWEGNYAHWNKLLSSIFVASTAKMKTWFTENVRRVVKMAAQSGRTTAFWGCGAMASRLAPYFLCAGIVPKLYDRNENVTTNGNKYERIPKDRFIGSPKDFFVVVTVEAGRDSIIEDLKLHGFEENVNYCAVPYSSALFR
jgi:hypothetical protein